MKILIHIPDTVKNIECTSITNDLPVIDLEAIIDYICNEYMFGTGGVDGALSDCLDAFGGVLDCDYCEVTYTKLVSEIHNLILRIHQRLDEYMLKHYPPNFFNDLRLLHRWKDLYVFELK
jgi:hypothetical protein